MIMQLEYNLELKGYRIISCGTACKRMVAIML